MQTLPNVKRIVVAITVAAVLSGVSLAAQWRMDESSVPRMKMAEFQALLATDGVLVVDVRDVQSYMLGHIPGAISVPLGTEDARIDELTRAGKPIVTYCT